VVLTGISGPKPPTEAFSLDVSVVPAIYSAVFSPTPEYRLDRSRWARRSTS